MGAKRGRPITAHRPQLRERQLSLVGSDARIIPSGDEASRLSHEHSAQMKSQRFLVVLVVKIKRLSPSFRPGFPGVSRIRRVRSV
jgi:hypothetical protein